MVTVSNADRVVFPQVGRTKGEVVDYYERIAPRALPHLRGRPLSIRRFPKGLAAPGFFQKNVPPHYPASIERFAMPRASGKDGQPQVTVYPLVRDAEQLAYLGNQGAIELHVPTARAPDIHLPDRFVIDLDPPANAFAQVRAAALLTRDALAAHGLRTVPVATGSKGYHVVAAITPSVDAETLALTAHKFVTLLSAQHARTLTTTYRVSLRGKRVFLDWLRNNPGATAIAPFSLRATARATVAVPLAWEELDAIDPDAFSMADLDVLLTRSDALADLAPSDPVPFVRSVEQAFAESGLELAVFDRFRS